MPLSSLPACLCRSVLLRYLGPLLRTAAGVGSWQVVSQGRGAACGALTLMPDLASIQASGQRRRCAWHHKTLKIIFWTGVLLLTVSPRLLLLLLLLMQGQRFDDPLVIVAERLTGNEDIPVSGRRRGYRLSSCGKSSLCRGMPHRKEAADLPCPHVPPCLVRPRLQSLRRTPACLCACTCLQEGVAAVLTSSPTDVLSHIAIRARAQGVLLATCFDAEGECRCPCVCGGGTCGCGRVGERSGMN